MPGRKRRKAKQPEHLLMRDAEQLHLQFRTNFRLDRDEVFLSVLFMAVMVTLVTFLMALGTPADKLPVVLAFGGIGAAFWGVLGVRLYNQTHIDMDEDRISISRKPIPVLFGAPIQVSLDGVTAIRCEETEASRQQGYDTPRYVVWAEREDGSRRVILKDVTEAYAQFIAQALDERLQDEWADEDEAVDYSRLADDGEDLTDGEVDFGAVEGLRRRRGGIAGG